MNDNNYIIIPGTDIRLYEDDIVELSSYPGHQFYVKQSEYQYKNQSIFGWHLESISNDLSLPIDIDDPTWFLQIIR